MNKIFLILLSMIFAGTLFAQPPEKRPALDEREKIIAKIEKKIELEYVLYFLKKCDYDIQIGIIEEKPISAKQYFSFATKAQIYLEYRWFIADTGLSKKWLKKIHKLFDYMYKTKSYMQAAKFNGRTKSAKYKKASGYFDLAYERLGKLIKKPVKVSSKVMQNAVVKKDMWQRKMRKKYNIKEKTWYE